MTGGKMIRRSAIAAVSAVAIVAGFVSCRHALQVVAVHGESGLIARACPVTIDGLICAASMVLLNAARRGLPRPPLACVALALGIMATLAANVAAGLAWGLVGAVVAAWPAPALVISYELLMLVIRSGAADTAPVDTAPVDTPPVDTAPADTAPADRIPADMVPVDRVPAQRRERPRARKAASGTESAVMAAPGIPAAELARRLGVSDRTVRRVRARSSGAAV